MFYSSVYERIKNTWFGSYKIPEFEKWWPSGSKFEIREYTKDGKYPSEKYTEFELVFRTENFRHTGRCLRVYKDGTIADFFNNN